MTFPDLKELLFFHEAACCFAAALCCSYVFGLLTIVGIRVGHNQGTIVFFNHFNASKVSTNLVKATVCVAQQVFLVLAKK